MAVAKKGVGVIQDDDFIEEYCIEKDIADDRNCDQQKYEACIKRKGVDKIDTYDEFNPIVYNCVSWARKLIVECQIEACM